MLRPVGELYLQSDVLPVKNAFTTRYGGVSTGHLSSLNLGENRGDDPDNVRENYRRVCAALDIDPQKLVFSRQVHGAEVRAVTAADSHELFTAVPYEADGLVTKEKGLPLIIFVADCVPVLLCDPSSGVAAAVHCGWRSSVQDILGVAVSKMCDLGAEPKKIRVAIGPAIGSCCFETGQDVRDALHAWLGADAENFIRPKPEAPEKYLCDIKGANRHRLLTLGLLPQNIDMSEACTMCEPDKFWSHRATKGERGSQAAIIQL